MSQRQIYITTEDRRRLLADPHDADYSAGKISIVAPIGAALIGYRVGDVVDWEVPAGRRRLRIEEILFQPEAAGRYDL